MYQLTDIMILFNLFSTIATIEVCENISVNVRRYFLSVHCLHATGFVVHCHCFVSLAFFCFFFFFHVFGCISFTCTHTYELLTYLCLHTWAERETTRLSQLEFVHFESRIRFSLVRTDADELKVCMVIHTVANTCSSVCASM